MKPQAKLRVVLMADDAVVAEYPDAELWRAIFASRAGLKRKLGERARLPTVTPERRLQRLTGLAVIAPDEAAFVAQVMEHVAAAYGVPAAVMRGPARARRIATARSVAMYLMRTHTTMTFAAVARYFDRHHSTVMTAVKEIEARRVGDGFMGYVIANLVDLAAQPVQ